MLVSQGAEVAKLVPEETGFTGSVPVELNLDCFYSNLEAREKVLLSSPAALTTPAQCTAPLTNNVPYRRPTLRLSAA